MFSINVDKECGCFKRSPFENNQAFDNKDDALIEAKRMEAHMNEKFCQRHIFVAEEAGDNFTISMNDRPREATSSGCCGGGHCS
jgi:xylose isomerase